MNFASKYSIGTRIGRGYSGIVFDCISRNNGDKYACKIISGKQGFERNNRELAILENLNHNNINPVKEVFHKNDGKPYTNIVVSELAHGDIFDYVEENTITEDIAKHIIKQLTEGVNYLHVNNVCHSDLKLQNILYVDNVKRNYEINHKDLPENYQHDFENIDIKLIDFEFSKYTHENGVRKELTGRSGTISYMAPEMLKKESYCELVDMWSLGVITYSLLFNIYPIQYTKIEVPESFNINYSNLPIVSDLALDFTKNLLVEDPNCRMTSQEALRHEWLQA